MYAILFDLDGTLVDSDPVHFEAWQKILAEIHVNEPLIDRAFFDKHISGRNLIFYLLFLFCYIHIYNLGRLNADITRELLPNLSKDEQEKLADRKELLFRQLAQEQLQPTKGLDKIIQYIKHNRSKLKIGKKPKEYNSQKLHSIFFTKGLATNAPRSIVDFELGLLKLDEKTFFDAALLAEEFGIGKFLFIVFLKISSFLIYTIIFLNKGKPNPDIYLELARRLNVDKNSCIIFEDSTSGVRAAVAAEIKCIGVLTSAKKETLEQYGTWRTVKDFQEVNLDEIWKVIESK